VRWVGGSLHLAAGILELLAGRVRCVLGTFGDLVARVLERFGRFGRDCCFALRATSDTARSP
jgi:hypothetical protein